MKERLAALRLNLRMLLQRVEELQIEQPDYEVNAKLGKIELKIDEINDLLNWIEAEEEL